MAETPTNLPLGYVTEAQFLSTREYAIPKTNRAGVPNTRAGCDTKANAVYADALVLHMSQVNEVFAGRSSVPGIAGIAGKSWRPGDDGTDLVESADLTLYGVQAPTNMWQLDGSLGAYLGLSDMVSYDGARPDGLYSLENARGGITSEARLVHAARSVYGLHYRSDGGLYTIGATMAFGMFVSLHGWNQSPDGIVLAAHRRYDGPDETSASYRLGWELGLGYASGSATADELSLYYRHRNASGAEVIRRPVTGGGGRIALPVGREFFIGLIRTTSSLSVIVNGLIISSVTFSGPDAPVPGNAQEMRLLLGGQWDGSRYLNGSIRSAALWTGTQPNAAQLQNVYRIGAGFIPKAP